MIQDIEETERLRIAIVRAIMADENITWEAAEAKERARFARALDKLMRNRR